MISQLRFLEKFDYMKKFHIADRQDRYDDQENTSALETVICFEMVLIVCYLTLENLIRNQNTLKDCRRFREQAQAHKEGLKKLFLFSKESEATIENMANKYLLQLDPLYLLLGTVLTLSISLAENKGGIYKHLIRTHKEHSDLLNRFINENIEEMDFLKREDRRYLKSIGNSHLNILPD